MGSRAATSVKPPAAAGAALAADAVAQHVGFLLSKAHQRFRQAIVEALAGSGVNPGQLAVLGALAAASGLSQTELAAATGIEKSSIVILVDALESVEWVRRRARAGDRRAHAVELTAKGKRQLRALAPMVQQVEARMLQSFSAVERRSLLALLQRLLREPAQAAQSHRELS